MPLISNVFESAQTGIRIMYVSPLKALINDQFRRIETLCSHLEFPITAWHGDANQTQKARLLERPRGILLITPESLEAMFQNRPGEIARLFGQLEYAVIDEIHSFLDNSRGVHLKSLLYRIGLSARVRPSKIGLSATIANPEIVARWINRQNPESVRIIRDTTPVSGIQCRVTAFLSNYDEFTSEERRQLYKYSCRGKNLIFANAKNPLELACDSMRQFVQQQKLNREYCIHHGSLSNAIREDVERQLKTDEGKCQENVSVFCTSTLELGIDIGDIRRIILLNPPSKVSSLIQRLGRSGRSEGQDKELVFFLKAAPITADDPLAEKLRAPLIQAIAEVELMIDDWQDPLPDNSRDFSTFVHQILSILGERRAVLAKDIYRIVALGAFDGVFSLSEFMGVLGSLKKNDLIYQRDDGSVYLTRSGERLVEDRYFYAAFPASDEWSIVANGQEIGRLSFEMAAELQIGCAFLLAGKPWSVVQIVSSQKRIIVKKGEARRFLRFDGLQGEIHPTIQQKMLDLYRREYYPPYLAEEARPIVEAAWEQYRNAAGNDKRLFTLSGTKVHRTLAALLNWRGVRFTDEKIAFINLDSDKSLKKTLADIDFDRLPIDEILGKNQSIDKTFGKFGSLLSDELLNAAYLMNRLDIPGARAFCERL